MKKTRQQTIGTFLMGFSGLALLCPVLGTLLFMGMDWLGPISVGNVSVRTYGNMHRSDDGLGSILVGVYLLGFVALFVVGFSLYRRRVQL